MKLFVTLIVVAGLLCCRSSNVRNAQPGTLTILSDTLVKDSLVKFNARPGSGFNFDYLVYLPKGLKVNSTSYLLVETTNTGMNDSIEYHEKGARFAAARSSVGNYIAKKLRIPLLVPVFPRPAARWMYYTHALDRDAFLSKGVGFDRLDLQLLAMIKDAKKQLADQNIYLHDKFFITGFSASGTFANRFSLLHPEKIKATASGGINAIAILPVSELSSKLLNYPLGIADIPGITGKSVKLKAFKNLPKLLFMGEKDDNDAVAFDDAYSKEERALVYELMGKQLIPQRWNFIRKIYEENNIRADFKTYPSIGHGTDLKINNDLVAFFKEHSR